jgi:hypothetical protein
VEIFGARGGDGNDNDHRFPGGYGARVAGLIALKAGQVLNVVVGQYGGYAFGFGQNSQGGGMSSGHPFMFFFVPRASPTYFICRWRRRHVCLD